MATPIADIHLNSELGWDFQVGNMTNIYIFSLIAFFILLIAAINYMNLATARSSLKAKEVGIRKVVGASRAHLIRLFLAESIIQTFIALLLAMLIVELLLPLINDISGKELVLSFRGNGPFILLILGVTFMVGLIAGSYPAFYLSSFMPAKILKEKVNTSRRSGLMRKIMITFQFAVSIVMISAIMVITRQVNYMNGADPGFNKDNVLVTHVTDSLLLRQMTSFKEELLRNPDILAASNSLSQPGLGMYMDVMSVDGMDKKEEHLMNLMYVDEDYIGLMEMQLIRGRNFDKAHATDQDQAAVINQALAEKFGWGDAAVGKRIYTGYQNPKEYKVVGVIKDFHFISLHQQIGPMVFFLSHEANPYLSVRIGSQHKEETIAFIEKKWEQFSTGSPYNYAYLADLMMGQYEGEKNLQKLIGYFALISIFISLLGIFGLSSFVTEQYNREIGIRKVFGASVLSIIYKLSWEFLQLVVIAFLLAFPVGWFIMQIWLDNFDYHISLRVFWFIASGLAVLAIAQLTVLIQSLNAASKSPLDVLKYE
jgi:putative ABC transport system permease protein